MTKENQTVSEHYGSADLKQRILAALRQAEVDLDTIGVEDLAPIDQFHTRGLSATRELLRLVQIDPDMKVLDVGSGLGGVARVLASEHGCSATGIDITEPFVEVAKWLSELAHLQGTTEFLQGDATALPFDAKEFDLAVTMQIQMNISEKERFYGEIFRVLKPGGRFFFQDIMAGDSSGDVHLPVPWSVDGEFNFLISVDALQRTLLATGFELELFEDTTTEALAWRKRQPQASGLAPAALGLHLVMGDQFGLMQANQVRNLEEGRVAFVRGVMRKPLVTT